MSDWLFDPAIFSAVFSAIAAAVSALTLWFTSLKGPDIDLCNIPTKVRIENPCSEQFREYIPDWFDVAPMQLVFSNNGSRGGVISSVRAQFQPSPGFKPFFKEFTSSDELQWPGVADSSYRQLPVSIREGDNCVIRFKGTLSTLRWKNNLQIDQVSGISNVRKIVEESLKYNYQQFTNFLKFLESGEPFGTMTLYMTSTSRRWLRTRLETKKLAKEIEIANTFDTLTVIAFKSCLEDWNLKSSRLEEYLQRIPNLFDNFIEQLKQNNTRLSQEIARGRIYSLLNLEDQWKQMAQQSTEVSSIIVSRETDISEILRSVTSETKKFNDQVNLVVALGGDAGDEQIKSLEENRLRLKPQVEKTIRELENLRRKLSREVSPPTS
jgi:hypothetical protein